MGMKRITVIAVGFMMLLAVAVVPATTAAAADDTIDIGYVNWAEGIAMSYLMELIIEQNWDVEVTLTQGAVAPVFAGVAQGDLDFFMDAWFPVTHAVYKEEYGTRLDDYGTNYEGAKIGMVVPQYVTIDSIAEVADTANQFQGRIVGIDAGAGVMQATERAIEQYNLPVSLQASSGPAMTAALGRSVEAGDWVAVTGWTPHWKFARWDLKFLDDPKGVYGGAEEIHTVARLGFDQDYPEIAQLLENFYMTDPQLAGLEALIQDGMTPTEAGQEWIRENAAVVASWLP